MVTSWFPVLHVACAMPGLDVHGFNGPPEDLHGDRSITGRQTGT